MVLPGPAELRGTGAQVSVGSLGVFRAGSLGECGASSLDPVGDARIHPQCAGARARDQHAPGVGRGGARGSHDVYPSIYARRTTAALAARFRRTTSYRCNEPRPCAIVSSPGSRNTLMAPFVSAGGFA